VIENAQSSPYISPEVATQFFAHSILALPIYGYPDKVYWGALWVAFQRDHHFTAEDIQRAQQLTDVVALLISRVRLYQETLSRAELLEDFSLQVTRLTSDLRHTTLLPGIVESARSLLKAQRAALFTRVAGKEHLTCSHAIGLSEEYVQAVNQRTRPILEEAIFSEPVVLVPDVVQDVRTTGLFDAIRQEGFQAFGVFALTSPEGPRGALAVYWDRPHVISTEEVATARLFAERASDVLHNADLYAQATEQSLTDELTSLPNRRALDRQMGQESARSFRSGRPFTLIMMDLDGFKSINDNFGHPIGDSVLQQVATALRRAVRATDFIARYGGDEFAVILPETDMDAARLVAEKLRQSLATCDLRMPNTTQRYISASMGLAVFPHDTSVPEKLIEIADKRLYQAKHTRWGTIITH
jgi:diguanylate cyclase (GGDEF)-like protein